MGENEPAAAERGSGKALAAGTGEASPTAAAGILLLRAIRDGRAPQPPMAATLGFFLTEVDEGLARFEGTPGAGHLNPLGTVHGGWAAAIIDSALGCAVHSTCPAGTGYTTLEFKLNLVRALAPGGGPLVCEGRVRHRGRRTATAEATLTDGRGRLVAHGSGTCLFLGPDG